jgi:DNA repair ATPase RecN
VHLRLADFKPLSTAFSWDCRSTATMIRPEVPEMLARAVNELGTVLAQNFSDRALAALQILVGERVKKIEEYRAELEQQADRARTILQQAEQDEHHGRDIEAALQKLTGLHTQLDGSLQALITQLDASRTNNTEIQGSVAKLAQLDRELTDLEQTIRSLKP